MPSLPHAGKWRCTCSHKCLGEACAVELAGMLDVIGHKYVTQLRELPTRKRGLDLQVSVCTA